MLELSVAVTVMTFDPDARDMDEADHDVVPDAVPLVLFAAFAHVTVDNPTLSLAVPDSAIVLEVVE